jgi:TatA/E family protein of Tat protein translocase
MDAPIILIPAFIGGGSGIHWIIILVVALLLFGRRLPEIMRGLGGSIREFKKGIDVGDTPENNFPDGAHSRKPEVPPPAVNPPVAPSAHANDRVKTVDTAHSEPPKQS